MSFPGFLYEFANSPIAVAFPSYLALNLTTAESPTLLYWPFEQPYQPTPFSSNMFILTNDSAANIIRLPDASIASTSQSSILLNIGANTAILQDFTGGVVGNITATDGLSYYLVLTSNATQAGSWTLIPFGTASLAPIDVSDLVDAGTDTNGRLLNGGLAAIVDAGTAPGTYLKATTRVQSYDSATGNYTQSQGDRGTFLVVTGASNFNYNLLSAATAGNGFIFSINNTTPSVGGGAVTLIPQGGNTIDVAVLNPSNSASWISDGVSKWTSLGFGLNTIPLNFVDVTVSLAAGSNTNPSLSFFNDTTGSLGLFYDLPSNSMQIVQSYYNPAANPVVIADFYTTAGEPNGFVTLAANSTFSGTEAELIGSTFTSTQVTLPGSIFTNTQATFPGVDGGSVFNSTAVNLDAPSIQQQQISIYSMMRAYS